MTATEQQDTSKVLGGNDVLVPGYRLERTVDAGVDFCHLYMQTFVRSIDDVNVWYSSPSSSWPRVATIHSDRLLLYPVHANPHAQRYLNPQHGRIGTLIYVDDAQSDLPADVDKALDQISRRLPWRLFRGREYGYGLVKELDEIWRVLVRLSQGSTLVVTREGESHMSGDEIVVCEFDLEALRRAMNRIDRRKRDGVRMAKHSVVLNDLLTKLEPDRFMRSDVVPAKREPSRALIHGRTAAERREAGRASVAAVRENLPALAAESPIVLLELRAEIERVTLVEMIAKYEELLAQNLPESRWQAFFEANQFVLSLAFARPIRLLHTQFHAKGSSLEGVGAQIGDFLFREIGQGLGIVEIKKPGTELVRSRPYRNTEVYAPSDELSGAVTQTLLQQSHLRSNWLLHRGQPSLSQSMPDVIKCIVVAGRSQTDKAHWRSFEVFRNACKDVEIVTFDELLEKLRLILQHLSPVPKLSTMEAPF